MMAEQHSNTDIFQAVMSLTSEVASVKSIALSTQKQAEKTNGRVTKAEEFINALKAVDAYKEKQAPVINAQTVNYRQPWYESDGGKQLLVALAGVITVIGAVIALKGGV